MKNKVFKKNNQCRIKKIQTSFISKNADKARAVPRVWFVNQDRLSRSCDHTTEYLLVNSFLRGVAFILANCLSFFLVRLIIFVADVHERHVTDRL